MSELVLERATTGLLAPRTDEPQTQASPARTLTVPSLTFDLVETRAAFDALEADWNALFERSGRGTQVFQTFPWCWHWCNHFLPGGNPGRATARLAVVTARKDGRLVMVWPLVVERRHAISTLSWLGDPVSQYGDIVVEDGFGSPDALQSAWRWLVARIRPDAVSLRKTRADAAVAPLLAALEVPVVATEEAPYLDLASAPDFAAYEQRYSSHARRNRRRLLRRLNENGAVAFDYHQGGGEARGLATVGVAMKRGWLKRRGEVSRALDDERFAAFFADVAEGSGRETGCIVSALRSGGELGAVQIAVAAKGAVAMHVIVTGAKFERFGAGLLHLEATIAKAFEQGQQRFDLLAPRHDYKMDWADGVVEVRDHALALSLKGRAWCSGVLGLKPALKRAFAKLPPRARGAIATALRLGR